MTGAYSFLLLLDIEEKKVLSICNYRSFAIYYLHVRTFYGYQRSIMAHRKPEKSGCRTIKPAMFHEAFSKVQYRMSTGSVQDTARMQTEIPGKQRPKVMVIQKIAA